MRMIRAVAIMLTLTVTISLVGCVSYVDLSDRAIVPGDRDRLSSRQKGISYKYAVFQSIERGRTESDRQDAGQCAEKRRGGRKHI